MHKIQRIAETQGRKGPGKTTGFGWLLGMGECFNEKERKREKKKPV